MASRTLDVVIGASGGEIASDAGLRRRRIAVSGQRSAKWKSRPI